MDRKVQADVLYCENRGTVAVTPAPGGRLDRLVRRFLLLADPPQVWIFGDLWVNQRREGDSVTEFFHLRGVLSGSGNDARIFLNMCCDLGLQVRYDASITVPCSNGPHCVDKASWCWDFTRNEYMALRWDRPPTRKELKKLLTEATDATTASAPA